MPINIKKGETENEFISRCVGEEISAGKEQEQAVAICYSYWRQDKMSKITDSRQKVMARVKYDSDFKGINLEAQGLEDACWPGYIAIGTKELDGRIVPNCVPEGENMQEEVSEINVFGYNTKHFSICPGAIQLFTHLQTMPLDEETIGMVRSAAQVADSVFRIEKEVISAGKAETSQLDEVKLLVGDFKDIIEEIDEEVGMVHDVSFMDGHILKVQSYL